MALRDILTYPDPRLLKKAKPVSKFDQSIQQLTKDMLETMHHANGIGLAAPQVGVLLNIIVGSVPKEQQKTKQYVLCNPRIVEGQGKTAVEEACLSLPGFYLEVTRHEKIWLQAKDPSGNDFSMEADGLLAICIQHEMDHLEGRLLVHHASSLKRGLYRKKQIKLKKQALAT
jgi:peptide deformylase